MNGYKNPGPSQEKNKRIKPKIIESNEVTIYFLPKDLVEKCEIIIKGNQMEKIIPIDLKTFERITISMFKPPWNNY
jgi:hypothetical protein